MRAFIPMVLLACLGDPVAVRGQQSAIKVVVPFPAGGPTDTATRLVSQALSAQLGRPVIVENQSGAGGTIAARQVAAAAADGATLLVAGVSTFCTAPFLYRLPYDPRQAFAPIGTMAVDQLALVVNSSLGPNTADALVSYARAHSGELSYGSAVGIVPHFVVEMFKLKTGTHIVHVPYRGSQPMIADLLGGQIHLTVSNKSALLPHILTGKLRALAVTGAQRWPELPDVPTLMELGYIDAPYDAWFGLVAPAGTSAAFIESISAALNASLRRPEIQANYKKLGMETRPSSAEEFAALIADEIPRWAAIVKATGIKLN